MNSSRATIPLAIIFGGICVAGALYISIQKQDVVVDLSHIPTISTDDHILGSPTAKVVVITYTDFDCAFCKNFHTAMNQIVAQAGTTGEVAWVIRQFPLTEIHPNAQSHALASECAAQTGGNDMFWRFADALFAAQPVLPREYGTIAKSVWVQGDSFASCIANPNEKLVARIENQREDVLALGAGGTPYSIIFVNNIPVDVMEGGYSYSAIEAKIREVSR